MQRSWMKNYDPQKSIFQILVTSGFILPNIFMMQQKKYCQEK